MPIGPNDQTGVFPQPPVNPPGVPPINPPPGPPVLPGPGGTSVNVPIDVSRDVELRALQMVETERLALMARIRAQMAAAMRPPNFQPMPCNCGPTGILTQGPGFVAGPSYPPLPAEFTGVNVTFETQIAARMRLFGETAEVARRNVQCALNNARVFTDADVAAIRARLGTPNPTTSMIRLAGVSVVILTWGINIIEARMRYVYREQIREAIRNFIQQLGLWQTTQLNAGVCTLIRDNLDAMERIVNRLNEQNAQLNLEIGLPAESPNAGGQPAFRQVRNAMRDVRNRLQQECPALEATARQRAAADPCTILYMLALELAIQAIAEARGNLWDNSTTGRAIEGQVGESADRMVAFLQQMQGQLDAGGTTTGISKNDINRVVSSFDNPENPFNQAIVRLRNQPPFPGQAAAVAAMRAYAATYRAIFQELQRNLAICPPPVLPCRIPDPPPLPPGS